MPELLISCAIGFEVLARDLVDGSVGRPACRGVQDLAGLALVHSKSTTHVACRRTVFGLRRCFWLGICQRENDDDGPCRLFWLVKTGIKARVRVCLAPDSCGCLSEEARREIGW